MIKISQIHDLLHLKSKNHEVTLSSLSHQGFSTISRAQLRNFFKKIIINDKIIKNSITHAS